MTSMCERASEEWPYNDMILHSAACLHIGPGLGFPQPWCRAQKRDAHACQFCNPSAGLFVSLTTKRIRASITIHRCHARRSIFMTQTNEQKLSLADGLRPEYAANPYELYRQLREADPVYWDERANGWVLTRYVDVSAALRDARFSAAG